MKIALGIEYEGTHFQGWQKQPKQRTIQQCLEQALTKVADHPINVICAGRTDAGVHAMGQVVHFETETKREDESWMLGGNANLPPDVRITWVKPVAAEFNARFSATARRYHYNIYNSSRAPALFRHYVSWEPMHLDAAAMQVSAQYLLGEHDFSAFRAHECQSRSAKRYLHEISVIRNENLITIDVKANAFLHHMVRNIAGVLIAIGCGRKTISWTKQVLESKSRQAAGITAKASGLFLVEVEYPHVFAIPKARGKKLDIRY